MTEATSTAIEWIDADHFVLDAVRYRTFGHPEGLLDMAHLMRLASLRSTADELVLAKTRGNVERCFEALTAIRPKQVLELGIYQGGSVAFIASLCRPDKLVAVDLDPEPQVALEEHLRARGLDASVKLHYGIDQADAQRIPELVEGEFDGPLDLVIDDASHFVAETRRSFNMLFPRLRPGGTYIIEDWAWAHTTQPGFVATQPPLSELVFELVIASATRSEAITDVTVNRELTVVRRGPEPLDAQGFDVSELMDDRARSVHTSFS